MAKSDQPPRVPMPLAGIPTGARLFEMSLTLEQDNDCCDPDKLGQELTLAVEDGGGGPFVVIKTERWACEPADLKQLARLADWACQCCAKEETP